MSAAERAPGGGAPEVPDFRRLDFPRLWEGRERTTEVEGRLLERALARHDGRRRAELGTGAGRLSASIERGAAEYWGLDHQIEFLRVLAAARPPGPGRRYVAANLYRLPFSDASLTSSVSVRVFNFLADPAAVFREVARATAPGGRLLLTTHPHPSVGSLADDVKSRLEPGLPRSPRARTFSRASPVPVAPAALPSWSWTRESFRRIGESAGWRLDAEYAVGLEDYRGLRRLPASVFLGLSGIRPVVGLRPTWFTDWVRTPEAGTSPKDAGTSVLSCPACRRPIDEPDRSRTRCPGCGLPWELVGEVADLRVGPLRPPAELPESAP